MRAVAVLSLALALSLAPVRPASPLRPPAPTLVPLGFVAGRARETLAADWDRYNIEPGAPERGYCVTRDSVATDWVPAGYHAVFVLDVVRAEATDSGVMHVQFDCHGRPALHTHGGYCQMSLWGEIPSTCVLDDPRAFQCQPSIPDIHTLLVRDGAYDVVQCGPEAFAFYWRENYTTNGWSTP